MSDSGTPGQSKALERVACALCGGAQASSVLSGRDIRRRMPGSFSVVRCENCGLAYVTPRPTPHGIRQYYPVDYTPHRLGRPSFAETVYYRLFRAIDAPAGARVLDVGCGGGKYLLFLRDRGYQVSGVETNEDLARELRDGFGLDVRGGELLDAGLPDHGFDVVTFWWVLEHTHRPLDVLIEAHRILRRGGKIVVALQNFESLGRVAFGRHWHHIDLPCHLYQFDPHTLGKTLEAAGFSVRRIRQDLIAKDFAPSLGYRLGMPRSLDWWLPNLLSIPFDLLAWSLRRSGLITAFADRP